MRYAQTCHGAVDFPLFADPLWHRFVYFVNDELLEREFSQPLNIEFDFVGLNPMISDRGDDGVLLYELDAALFATTLPGQSADRIRLDTEHTARGRDFGENFNELAEAMFQIGQDIEGFIRFQE